MDAAAEFLEAGAELAELRDAGPRRGLLRGGQRRPNKSHDHCFSKLQGSPDGPILDRSGG